LKDEQAFKNDRFIIETIHGERKFLSEKDFIKEGNTIKLTSSDKALVFVGDLAGHFVTFVICKVLKNNGDLEDNALLLNSTKGDYLEQDNAFDFFNNLINSINK